MPAPSPSIRPVSARTSGSRRRPSANWSSSSPPASAISEATSVSAIATTLRNTSVSTIIATATPMSSPTGAVLCSAWSTIAPLRETSSPSRSPPRRDRRPGACRLLAEIRRGVVVLDGDVGDPAVARQLGDRLGSRAGRRPAHVRLARDRLHRPLDSGGRARRSRSVPSSTAKTTLAVSPAAAGKRSSSRSSAAWDSVPGAGKSSEKLPPASRRRVRRSR